MLLLQTGSAQNFSDLDALAEQRKKEFAGQQMSIMVWKDTILFQKVTGDMTINTQVPIGCASAWVTAAVVMSFVDQGKISLDDPVSKYLPIFSKYAKSYLTVRHCLANTTGLEPEKGSVERFQKSKFPTLEDQVNSFASGHEIVNNPGEVFNYNNMGSNIAGRVLEVVGKKSFDRLALERVFRPLGMKKSTFMSEFAVNPFSGALSTPADYIKFLSMLLNKGTLKGKKVLSEESVAEMQKLQTGPAKIGFVPKVVEGYNYSLGNWIGGTGLFTSPGLNGGWPYINVNKKYACVVFGVSKDKREKEDKTTVYAEVMEKLESRF